MLPTRLSDLAATVGGTLTDAADPGAMVTAPAVPDSRHIQPGGLFVALAGARVDGHDYAADAVKGGASAVLAARHLDDVPAIVVDDVHAAFGRLAVDLLARLTGTSVVALAGAAGRSSARDLLAHLLSAAGETVAAERYLACGAGLPTTVTRATEATRYLVLEPESAPGPEPKAQQEPGLEPEPKPKPPKAEQKAEPEPEPKPVPGPGGHDHRTAVGLRDPVRELTRLAPPCIAAVLNTDPCTAHATDPRGAGRTATARAKGDLVEALPSGGLAVLNADDPLVRDMTHRTRARVILVGSGTAADVRAERVRLDAGRPRFTLRTPEGEAEVHMRLIGEHHVAEALTAAAVAREAGLSVTRIAERLSTAASSPRWRMEVTDSPDGVTVINDAYNADPHSVAASLKALAGAGHQRRTVAVLGEMRGLGERAQPAHADAGKLAAGLGVDRLICVGGSGAARMSRSATEAGMSAVRLPDQEAARALLERTLRPGDVVLVKADRDAGLYALAEALLERRCGAT